MSDHSALIFPGIRVPRRAAVRAIFLIALLAALVVALVTTMTGPTKDDIAWLLYVAQRWLHGSRLYIDIVEVNPPLIVWLCAVPTAVADLVGLQPADLAIPFFCVIILASAAWAVRILDDGQARLGDPVIVFSVASIVLLLVPAIELGQREHLLVAMALPYFAVVGRELARDAPGRATAIGAAVLAALGCAFKPRYVLAFGAVELWAAWQGLRLLRPSTLAAASALAAYVLAVALVEPAFFREAIPMAFALYGASDVPLLDLMFDCRLLLLGIAVATLLITTRPSPIEPRSRLPAVLVTFAIGATVVCILDGKNWFYHRLPATIAAILCLIAWATQRPRAAWLPAWRIPASVGLAALVLILFGLRTYERVSHEMGIALARDETTATRLARLIVREHAHSYVAFSDWIGLGFPVVNNTGVAWASRFDSMWALDGELWRAARDGRAPSDWPVRRWVTADFRSTCPDIVVVDRRSKLNYVDLLGRADPAFLALWRSYRRIAAFGGLVVFRRMEQPGPGLCHKPPDARG